MKYKLAYKTTSTNHNKHIKLIMAVHEFKSWVKFGQKMGENFSQNQMFYGTLEKLGRGKEFSTVNIKDKDRRVIAEEDKIMER